jgi:hypothetical protein
MVQNFEPLRKRMAGQNCSNVITDYRELEELLWATPQLSAVIACGIAIFLPCDSRISE